MRTDTRDRSHCTASCEVLKTPSCTTNIVPTGNSFTFSYKFEPTAPSCAGDFGRAVVTNQTQPWDYNQPRR